MNFSIDDTKQLPREFWAELVRLRAGYTCQDCGIAPEHRRLDAHHLDSNKLNNCLSNGRALCVSCHARVSANDRWDAGTIGRSSWTSPEMQCEHCDKVILVKNYQKHLKN